MESSGPIRVRLSPRVTGWADNSVLLGGSPWRVIRIAAQARVLVDRLAAAGPRGIMLSDSSDIRIARALLDRGFLSPLPMGTPAEFTPDVVVPVLDATSELRDLLASMPGANVIVVDDGSADPDDVTSTADAAGAHVIRHMNNLGPAEARNTGIRHTDTRIVGFIDADCIASPHWHTHLLFHFDDPRVAAVAPRVRPTSDRGSRIERFEQTRSALDMGPKGGLVRPGARPSFVPSAALLVRRSAVGDTPFDPELRLGEDVDLIWRLTEGGWLVRYDPSVVVRHRTRVSFRQWISRRFQYGTSAANLEERHPGYLTPLRSSPWNTVTLSLIATGHPFIAAAVTLSATTLLWRQLRDLPAAPALAIRLVAQGVVADGAALGHLLRREWWPIGMLFIAATPRSRVARWGAVTIFGPVAWEWVTTRPKVDPVSYTVLRLIEDAAYGSGVIASGVRSRTWTVLTPRLSHWRRKRR